MLTKLQKKEYRERWTARQVALDPEYKSKENAKSTARKHQLKIDRPVYYKAGILINGLRWGRGGAAKMEEILNAALGTSCKYCGIILTLDNCSLDHKTPLPSSSKKLSRRTEHSKGQLSLEEVEKLNMASNLHIVCLKCNQAKGNLTHEEFTALLGFLEGHPRMKKIVIAKMKGSNFMYKR